MNFYNIINESSDSSKIDNFDLCSQNSYDLDNFSESEEFDENVGNTFENEYKSKVYEFPMVNLNQKSRNLTNLVK